MTRSFAIGAAGMTLVIGLAGCGGGTPAPPPGGGDDASAAPDAWFVEE